MMFQNAMHTRPIRSLLLCGVGDSGYRLKHFFNGNLIFQALQVPQWYAAWKNFGGEKVHD